MIQRKNSESDGGSENKKIKVQNDELAIWQRWCTTQSNVTLKFQLLPMIC